MESPALPWINRRTDAAALARATAATCAGRYYRCLVAAPAERAGLQLISTCGARIVSGHAALREILMRSFSDERVPNAQQAPQYLEEAHVYASPSLM